MLDLIHLRKPARVDQDSPTPIVFREDASFRTEGEPVLITDPMYLADVFHGEDTIACYLREHGVILDDFGGDFTCPVWWQPPYLILPVDSALKTTPPAGASALATNVGCDSARLIFLPLKEPLPTDLRNRLSDLDPELEVVVTLPPGIWSIWYAGAQEIDGAPCQIVIRHEPRHIEPGEQLALDF